MYYLYSHTRLDKNEIFYIGIGTVNIGNTLKSKYKRAFQKTKSRNPYWKNIVNKVSYKISIILHRSGLEEIMKMERRYIRLHKKTLCNMTSGGLGIESYKHSNKTKKKISKSTKGKKLSVIHKLRINEAKKKRVIMFSKFGVKERYFFNSLKEAAEYLGDPKYIKNISACLRGLRPTAYGYKFKIAESKNKES